MQSIPVFVGHAFDDRVRGSSIDDFRAAINSACREAEKACARQNVKLRLRPFFAGDDFGGRLPGMIEHELEGSAAGIFDLTGLRPNVLYELGVMTGLDRPVVVLMRKGTKLPADLAHVLVAVYGSDDEIPQMIADRLTRVALAAASSGAREWKRERPFWFSEPAPQVTIVCSPEPERSRFASRTEANYLFIDNLEDRDALFEVSTYLCRTHSQLRLQRCASDSIPPDSLRGDLVLIGGPGENEDSGNHVTRDVLKAVAANISFPESCDRATFKRASHVPVFDKLGRLRTDFGYFLRDRNPYNPDRTVIVIAGVYTAGTLGAALAFSDHPGARDNVSAVRKTLKLRPTELGCFEAFFRVDVSSSGVASCPRVSSRWVIPRGTTSKARS